MVFRRKEDDADSGWSVRSHATVQRTAPAVTEEVPASASAPSDTAEASSSAPNADSTSPAEKTQQAWLEFAGGNGEAPAGGSGEAVASTAPMPTMGPLARRGPVPPGEEPPAPPVAERQRPRPNEGPPDNSNAILAVIVGGVALVFGLFPFTPVFGIIAGLVALVLGGAGLRRVANYGASGRGLSLTGMVMGLVAVCAALFWVIDTSRQVGENFGQMAGMFNDLTTSMNLSQDVSSTRFPGTGSATFTVGDANFPIEVQECGLDNPAQGIVLGGHGYSYPGPGVREAEVQFVSTNVGETRDLAGVSIGSQDYLIQGSGLFVVDGDTATLTGQWRRPFEGDTVEATLAVTCTH